MFYHSKRLADFGILKDFNGQGFKLVHLVSYRQPGFEDDRKHTPKGQAGNDTKLCNNLCRTKSRIFELAICNPWQWFVTLTLDSKKRDRLNLEKFVNDLSQFIRDYRKSTGNPVKYLLIPEHHKDGCWHMHGFFMGLPAESLHAFQRTEHLPYRILQRLDSGVQVYTWAEYAARFGYADFEEIGNHEAVSKYITKYITKESMNTITELNAHAFYASKGLEHSEVIRRDFMQNTIQDPDFQNDHCTVKWFEDLNTAITYFGEEAPGV